MISRNFRALQAMSLQPPKNLPQGLLRDQFAFLKKEYNPTKYPVVLCHGLSGFDSLVFLPRPNFWRKSTVKKVIKDGLFKLDYWYGIQNMLTKIGCEVYVGKVPPFGAISERATSLNSFLESQFEGKQPMKVNLIAHSMGGLDARYLISKLQAKNYKVASLTTVSTPHRGSEVADFVLESLDPNLIFTQAIPQLSTQYLEKFNKEVLDDPDVEYFSYGARFRPTWFNVFKYPWHIIQRRILAENRINHTDKPFDNDGLVSVESAKWGEYLGTLDGVDHLDLINWTNRLRTFVDHTVFHHKASFNALAFYAHIVHSLAKRGL